MCIIILATKRRIDAEMVTRATMSNRDGIGLAWREKGAVQWRKGLTNNEAAELCASLPTPYAFHARMATVGGNGPELTHPFPVEPIPRLDLQGVAPSVLLHNGHVAAWRPLLLASGETDIGGKWSDSRAIAHVVAQAGPALLGELEGSRFLLFGAQRARLIGNWTRSKGGFFLSSHLPSLALFAFGGQGNPGPDTGGDWRKAWRDAYWRDACGPDDYGPCDLRPFGRVVP